MRLPEDQKFDTWSRLSEYYLVTPGNPGMQACLSWMQLEDPTENDWWWTTSTGAESGWPEISPPWKMAGTALLVQAGGGGIHHEPTSEKVVSCQSGHFQRLNKMRKFCSKSWRQRSSLDPFLLHSNVHLVQIITIWFMIKAKISIPQYDVMLMPL